MGLATCLTTLTDAMVPNLQGRYMKVHFKLKLRLPKWV
uniref:Uncharacterized protein n=1 Tax=Rhizophora mucronata TaxID=61149 RepID=A0A2P2KAK8_RHIMU